MHGKFALETLAHVIELIAQIGLPETRRRDMTSVIRRTCEMAGRRPVDVGTEPPALRAMITRIRPAAHNVSPKSWSTMRSVFNAALRVAGLIDDSGRGQANRDSAWAPLMQAVAGDKRLSGGLAAFANW